MRPSRIFFRHFLPLLLILCCPPIIHAQIGPDAQGLNPNDYYSGGKFDSVSMTNGNIMLHIPLLSYPQRGRKLTMNFYIASNDKSWGRFHVVGPCSTRPADHLPCFEMRWVGYGTGNWSGVQVVKDQTLRFQGGAADQVNYLGAGNTSNSYLILSPVTADGSVHEMADIVAPALGSCLMVAPQTFKCSVLSGTQRALDGSGLLQQISNNGNTTVLMDRDGVRYELDPSSPFSYGNTEDPNGNMITATASGWTDTLGRSIPSAFSAPSTATSGCPAAATAATLWSPPGPGGTSLTFKLCFENLTVQTNLGSASTADGTFSGRFLLGIVLPNQTSWQFTYDSWGSLTSVTLPTGGTISYSYDTPIRFLASRTVDAHDGTGAHVWNYRWGVTMSDGVSVGNIVTDPLGNDAVHWLGYPANMGGFRSVVNRVQDFQGLSPTGTLLQTVDTDYSAAIDPYSMAPINVMPVKVTTIWPNGLVSQKQMTYDSAGTFVCSSGPNVCPANPITFTLGTLQQESVFDYGQNSPGVIDSGGVSPGPLLRKTIDTYMAFSGPNASSYLANNLLSLPYTAQILDGGSSQMALTQYNYDGSALASSGIGSSQQHDTNPPAGAFRGNLTSVQQWLNSGPLTCPSGRIAGSNSMVTSASTFFDTGEIQTSTDPCGNAATYAYSSTYVGAYPTTITNALNQPTTHAYDFNTGLLTSTTDPNHQATSYSYDSMRRISQVNYPDGGQTTICYTDEGGATCQQSGPPYQLVTTQIATPDPSIIHTTVFDGLGRVSQTQLSDPEGTDLVDTTYDVLGRVATVSNPHRSSALPTDGVNSTFYDALGRPCLVVPPDGTLPTGGTCPTTTPPANTIFTTYSGNCATVTDQAGKSRQSCSDGLGRLTQVTEDPGSSPHLNYVTTYTYNTLDDLIGVVQNGSRQRSFTYDSLSRLLSATNPESGTVSYTYDPNGNVLTKTSPAPNQTGTATVAVSYCYDALNRMTFKNYAFSPASAPACSSLTPPPCGSTTFPSAATFAAFFVYDCNQIDADTSLQNTVGRLVMSSQSIASTYVANTWTDYDAMGRIQHLAQCARFNCFTYGSNPRWWVVTNTYDLAGDLTSYTDANGQTFTQTFGGAGRPTKLTSSWSDSTHPATLIPLVTYFPNGSMKTASLANGLTETNVLNTRLQHCRMNTNSSATVLSQCTDSVPATGNLLDFNYGFSSGANNGNIASWTAAGQQIFSRSYLYDSLNRLSNMSAPSDPSGCLGFAWDYDAWGNRTKQIRAAGSSNTCNEEQPTTFNALNQFPGYMYDSAGNMVADGANFYFYDAENRLSEVYPSTGPNAYPNYLGTQPPGCPSNGVACYFYNAEGQRIAKYTQGGQATTFYIYGTDGEVVADTDGNLNWNETYIHFDGSMIGQYRGSATGFIIKDHLGSTRLDTLFLSGAAPAGCTQPAGATTFCIYDNMDYLPFGEQIAGSSAITDKFTSKERDAETGLDDFGARYMSSSMGRFMTTDPVVVTTERLKNPQQLNLYAYVGNNPLRFIDPTGELLTATGDLKADYKDLCAIAGDDCANRLKIDEKTGNVTFDVTGLDLSKNEGAALLNDLISSKNTYEFSEGPTVMTDKGPVKIDTITQNIPSFGDQVSNGQPRPGVRDVVALYLNNPKVKRVSLTGLLLAESFSIAFHELAEAYEKIDGGKGGSYAQGHDAALAREQKLRDQRPYLRFTNTGAGGPANGKAEDMIIRK